MRPIVLTETVLTFAEAAEACPTIAGKKPSAKTVYSWADTGVKAGNAKVTLETARVGGRRVTSREALERFFAATAVSASGAPVERSPATRRKSSEKAVAYLLAEFEKVK